AGKETEGGIRCLKLILHYGGDPNARSAEELTPLHVAASWGCYKCLMLLVRNGGDPGLRDQDGNQAVDLAKEQQNWKCVQILQKFHRYSLTNSRLSEESDDMEPLSSTQQPLRSSTIGKPSDTLGGSLHPLPSAHLDSTGRKKSLNLESTYPESSIYSESCGHSNSQRMNKSSSSSQYSSCEIESSKDFRSHGTDDKGNINRETVYISPQIQDQKSAPKSNTSSNENSNTSLFDETIETPTRRRRIRKWGECNSPTRLSTSNSSNLQNTGPANPDFVEDSRVVKRKDNKCRGDLTSLFTNDQSSFSTEEVKPDQQVKPPKISLQLAHLSDADILEKLKEHGEKPGPITDLTRKVYLQLLGEASMVACNTDYSPELSSALETFTLPDCKDDEMALSQQFDKPDKNRRWREGVLKSSFNYLLLDPRVTRNLPARCYYLSPAECFRTFVSAIFYVGKGKRSRPYSHLYEALTHYKCAKKQVGSKIQHILDIWNCGLGVISLHCFQNSIPVEAYTREACMVDAIGLKMLTNQKKGDYYGIVATWPMKRRRHLGVHILHRAMQIFLAEGERQLRPPDIRIGQ
uniref:Ankyrin repeat and LEM domain containing 1 n=1 Tax=Latimeria chalumnae TaxID=7897 RepID=H3AMC4_LATCH